MAYGEVSTGEEHVMAKWMAEIDQRTRLAGANKMELLMFHLGTDEIYGINVFKIREVMKLPPVTKIPDSDLRISASLFDGVGNRTTTIRRENQELQRL